MTPFYTKSIEEVSKELETDPASGLKNEEIQSRIEKYGKNSLVQKKNNSQKKEQ